MQKKGKLPVFIISGKSPINAQGGGYSTYSYNLARVIKKLGHPVYILALGNKNGEENTEAGKLIQRRVAIPLLNISIYALPGLPVYSYFFARQIKNIVVKNNFKKSIVWGIGPWGFTGTLAKLFLGKQVIHINSYFTTTRHEWGGGVTALRVRDYGIWPKLKYMAIYLTVVQYLALIEKIILKFTDKIIVTYHSSKMILQKEFNLEPKIFYPVRFYAKVYKRKVLKAKEGGEIKLPEKYLLFFSRQDPRKGVNFLLHAMKILIKRDCKIPLLIAGGGDMLKHNILLSKKLKVNKYVKFLGFVNNPKPLMKNCSVFVFPSIEEGAGALTINEAMEMGIPIVSTACDGIPEDIENRKTGILVPKTDVNAMAEAIEELLNNPAFAKKLGANAKKDYYKKFRMEYMEHDIRKLLLTL